MYAFSAYIGFVYLIISSGNIAALIKSFGSISKASAILKKISKEKGLTIFGASIALK